MQTILRLYFEALDDINTMSLLFHAGCELLQINLSKAIHTFRGRKEISSIDSVFRSVYVIEDLIAYILANNKHSKSNENKTVT